MFYTKTTKLRKRKGEVPELFADLSPSPLTKRAVPSINPQSAALSKAPLAKKGFGKGIHRGALFWAEEALPLEYDGILAL